VTCCQVCVTSKGSSSGMPLRPCSVFTTLRMMSSISSVLMIDDIPRSCISNEEAFTEGSSQVPSPVGALLSHTSLPSYAPVYSSMRLSTETCARSVLCHAIAKRVSYCSHIKSKTSCALSIQAVRSSKTSSELMKCPSCCLSASICKIGPRQHQRHSRHKSLRWQPEMDGRT
jgi:hypothetical protein